MSNADYAGYISGMLILIAGVLGVTVTLLGVSLIARRGSHLQLVMAWALIFWVLPIWLLTLMTERDMFSLVLLSRTILALPVFVSLLWLRRCVRVFRQRRNGLAPYAVFPWVVAAAGALLLICLDDQRGFRNALPIKLGGTIEASLIWLAMLLVAVGVTWGGATAICWLWTAGPAELPK
ncbi:hypothetical protein [Cupriavidus sp. WS]|uniref:hypothetical protein n=1 Tax=Cupriavidus sp. WS TaxID=1312922 RepID=UPI0012DCAF7D|nr:hypothetical protein [Cupriavidus sp. WS]